MKKSSLNPTNHHTNPKKVKDKKVTQQPKQSLFGKIRSAWTKATELRDKYKKDIDLGKDLSAIASKVMAVINSSLAAYMLGVANPVPASVINNINVTVIVVEAPKDISGFNEYRSKRREYFIKPSAVRKPNTHL